MEKISQEVAESEFDRFIEAMDIDVDQKGMDDEDRKSYESARRKLVRAMMRGSLSIDEKGQPVFTPSMGNTDPITFHEPTGASIMAMDQKKKNHDVSKIYATMADATKQPVARFSRMHNRDIKICTAVITLFLG